jgi:hypothetical protein
MDLEALHHLFLFRHVSDAGGHILKTHCLCFGVAFLARGVYNLCYFFVDLLEHFNTVGVAETDPEIILVIQMNRFLIKFKSAIVARKTVFVLRNIRLVKVIVCYRSD